MRYSLKLLVCGVLAAATAACQMPIHTTPVSLVSPAADKVQAALDHWPKASSQASPIKRPFFATVHAAGRRVTASGVLEYYSPRDFRITAVTEVGALLFDGRVNWAGVTVLREMPGMDKSVVETILSDMAEAFEVPSDIEGLGASAEGLVLHRKAGDTHEHTWIFDPRTGRLMETEVDLGAFDTLHVDYRGYTPFGWPEELVITRKARLYDISFTFTDTMVQGNSHGNMQ